MQALWASAGNPIESIRQRAGEFAAEASRWRTTPAIRGFTEELSSWNASTRTEPAGKPEVT